MKYSIVRNVLWLNLLLGLIALLVVSDVAHTQAQDQPSGTQEYQLRLMPINQPDYLPPLQNTLSSWQSEGVISHFELNPDADLLSVTADAAFEQRWQQLPGVVTLLPPASVTDELTLQNTGTVTGQVTAANNGWSLSNIKVCANGSTTYHYACSFTATDGSYTLTGLPADDYRISFWDDSDTYVNKYYNNQSSWSSADYVTVSAGATTSGINAALNRAGSISGIVTAPGGVTPLANIDVTAYRYNSEYFGWGYWESVGWAETDATGAYQLTGLAAGVYRIEIEDTYHGKYRTEYYNNATDVNSATNINVTAGATTFSINATLAVAGHITGQVTGPDGVTPLENIEVTVYSYNAGWGLVDWAYTDAYGYYTAGPLETGVYRVGFGGWFVDDYVEEYYNNAFSVGNATNISVTDGLATYINASLARQRHFTNIEQPRFAAPDETLTFDLDFQIPNQGQFLKPRLGIRLPSGWNVINTTSLNYSGDNSGTFSYNATLTADLNNYYTGNWWAAEGQSATWSSAKTTVTISLKAPNTPGDYQLGLFIGDSNNGWDRLEEVPIRLTTQQPVRSGSVTAVRDYSGDLFGTRTSTSLQTATGLDMGVVYHYLGWNQLEPRPGVYNWDMLDDILGQVDAYGLKVILRFYNPPGWYSGVGSLTAALAQEDHYVSTFSQTEIRDFMEALTDHVRRNGQSDVVAGYVIWNEPNIAEQWDDQAPNAAAYMAMLQAAYKGAKAGDPAAKIISAPLAPTSNQAGVAINDLTYLGQLYDHGLKNYTDYVGMNGLGFQFSPDYDSGSAAYSFTRLKYLHDVMVSRDDSSRKVWALEVGWLRDSSYDLGSFNAYKVSDAKQQQYTDRAFAKAAAEWPWLELMSIWNLDFDRYYPPTSNFHWYTLKSATGDITGQITGSDGVTPVSPATIWVYQSRNGWWYAINSTITDAAGNYELTLPAGEYQLYVFADGSQYLPEYYQNAETLTDANSVTVTAGATTANINISLTEATPPLIDVDGDGWQSTDPTNGQVTVGALSWGENQITISYQAACSNGTVTLKLGSNSWPMTHQSGGKYQITLNLPDDMPTGSNSAALSVTVDCGSGPINQVVGSVQLYDPSGQVVDQNGQPVEGAQVNLYRIDGAQPDKPGQLYDCRTVETRTGGTIGDWNNEPETEIEAGSWVNPDLVTINGQAEINPIVNPQTTGSDGRYGWDVAEGCWYVVVEANGYQQKVSPLVGVPPEVTDLDLTLNAATGGNNVYLPLIVKE